MEFKTDGVFEALRSPLALVEDPERRQAFERYVEAARYPLERAVFDLLSGLVSAIDERVQSHYRVRLSYQPGALALELETKPEEPRQEPAGGENEWFSVDGDVEKITIRIPAELKDLAMQAAAGAGISANSWFVRSLARSIRTGGEGRRGMPGFPPSPPHPPTPPTPPTPPPPGAGRQGKRLHGWIGGQQ